MTGFEFLPSVPSFNPNIKVIRIKEINKDHKFRKLLVVAQILLVSTIKNIMLECKGLRYLVTKEFCESTLRKQPGVSKE